MRHSLYQGQNMTASKKFFYAVNSISAVAVVGYFGISAACYTAESAVKLFPAESLPAKKRAPYIKPFASECVIHIIICRYLFCREKFLIWS